MCLSDLGLSLDLCTDEKFIIMQEYDWAQDGIVGLLNLLPVETVGHEKDFIYNLFENNPNEIGAASVSFFINRFNGQGESSMTLGGVGADQT